MSINLTQKNISKEWQRIKLGDIGRAIIGLTYSPEDVVLSSGVLVFRSSNVNNGRVDYSDQVRVSSKIPELLRIREGDLLICARNGSQRLIGKNALMTKADEGNTFGAFMLVFRTKNSKYLYHLFQSQLFKKEINKDLGPTINQVTTGNLHSFKFYFPPLPEQNQIVSVLETWDKGVEKLTKKIELKKNVKKALMQKLLTGKVRLSGFSDKWAIASLSELADIVKNGVPEFLGLKKYYSTSAVINEDKIDFISYKERPSRADMYPIINDIAIAKMKGTNRCFIVNDKYFGNIFSTGFSFLRVKKNIDFFLIYYNLLAPRFQYFKDLYSASGIMGGIGNKDLLSIEIRIPKSKEEQSAIAKILISADNEIASLEKKLSLIKSQKKYLLNNLISGKIRTPENMKINV